MLLENLPKSASLPVATSQEAKRRIQSGSWDFDYIFFTESDQVSDVGGCYINYSVNMYTVLGICIYTFTQYTCTRCPEYVWTNISVTIRIWLTLLLRIDIFVVDIVHTMLFILTPLSNALCLPPLLLDFDEPRPGGAVRVPGRASSPRAAATQAYGLPAWCK